MSRSIKQTHELVCSKCRFTTPSFHSHDGQHAFGVPCPDCNWQWNGKSKLVFLHLTPLSSSMATQ